jgi:Tol biopolymer transport system component/imidazolonepropionase-like amidohydrolase
MRRSLILLPILFVAALALAVRDGGVVDTIAGQRPPGAAPSGRTVDVTVREGTSMSVAVSPDGRTLAIDLQGSIWTVPATGGPATRVTGLFDDARQPVWSPDGRQITYFAYTEGGYDIWTMAPDGANARKLTWGPFDDREPAWSHDGTRLAFSSDRGNPLGSDYNIWMLDARTGDLRQLTKNPAEDYMPSWSPDDAEIAFASDREGGRSVWAVNVATGAERRIATSQGRLDAPSWGPGGRIVYHSLQPGRSSLALDGRSLTGDENAFPFRVSWASAGEFYYVADGRIRRRSLEGGDARAVDFTATLPVTQVQYARRQRDFESITPRQVLGIVRPVISPDGTQVAFAALSDIYVMKVGERPRNITGDRALDTDPAWSPDGTQIVYSSDRGGDQLQLWIHDLRTGQSRQVTRLTTQPQGATWSPDGTRIAFFNVTGMWRVAEISVLDVASGQVTTLHDTLNQPGTPTWSPDGRRVAFAALAPYSRRYREGTNQVLTVSATGGDPRWYAPVPTLSIDSRGACGPVWSPDGTKMAAIYEGVLAVWPVSAAGEPLGPPRRVTTEAANSPSWQGDSRHILYLSMDRLRVVDVVTGETREVPLDLQYTMDVPRGRVIVHAGRLVDMTGPTARTDVDIVIEGNRVRSVEPHADSRHSAGQLVDATGLTVMPGMVDFHSHLQPDFGEAQGRAFLAFGVTAVQSPGGVPYEAVEEREAADARARIGPRVFSTGHLLEYLRASYKMAIALSSPAHLEMELERSRILQFDLFKSYVRLPDFQQKRVVEFAHAHGIPVATHEIYPAAYVGVDRTEHTAATSRRGYSPKQAPLQSAYEDVIQIFGKSGRVFNSMVGQTDAGTLKLFADVPALKDDPRFRLYPAWLQAQVAELAAGQGGQSPPVVLTGERGNGRMVMDAMRAGALIVSGTDRPLAIKVHGDIMANVMIGMTPYEALRTATVNAAQALGLDAGTIEPGKLADLVVVEGNPLENVEHTHRVKRVIFNGRVYEMDDLLKGSGAAAMSTRAGPP